MVAIRSITGKSIGVFPEPLAIGIPLKQRGTQATNNWIELAKLVCNQLDDLRFVINGYISTLTGETKATWGLILWGRFQYYL